MEDENYRSGCFESMEYFVNNQKMNLLMYYKSTFPYWRSHILRNTTSAIQDVVFVLSITQLVD